MKTTRLYYSDADLRVFDATVTSCSAVAGGAHVVLDQTAFYPTSGGQPFDTGRLGGATVTDVVDREDGTILHVVDRPLEVGSTVFGEIDWPRRLDHMQQHTGQHMLSAAFEQQAGVRTTSFHLGAEASTIDLEREVTPADIAAAEDAANRVVWENRPVTVRFVSEQEAAELPLRKEPIRSGQLRLVGIDDFDLSACGGTHVSQTGAVGAIGISRWERFKGGSRVSFVCGGRLVRTFGTLRDVADATARRLGIPLLEIDSTVARLQDENRELSRAIRRLEDELAGHRGVSLRAAAATIRDVRVVLRSDDAWSAPALKALALAVVSESGTAAVLVGSGDPAAVVVARSADLDLDARELIRRLAEEMGGRGGGRPELAQGGVAGRADAILERARAWFEADR